jgi:hypothetical protein
MLHVLNTVTSFVAMAKVSLFEFESSQKEGSRATTPSSTWLVRHPELDLLNDKIRVVVKEEVRIQRKRATGKTDFEDEAALWMLFD